MSKKNQKKTSNKIPLSSEEAAAKKKQFDSAMPIIKSELSKLPNSDANVNTNNKPEVIKDFCSVKDPSSVIICNTYNNTKGMNDETRDESDDKWQEEIDDALKNLESKIKYFDFDTTYYWEADFSGCFITIDWK